MTQPPSPVGYQSQPQPAGNGLAVASLVLGILACITMCLWFLSIPLGVLALVLGAVAGGKIKRGEASGAGMAKAGLILGIIGIALGVLFIIIGLFVSAGAKAGGNFLQRKAQEIQQESEKMQKQAEEAQRKAQEQQQKLQEQQNQTPASQGASLAPAGWDQLAQWTGLEGRPVVLIVPAGIL